MPRGILVGLDGSPSGVSAIDFGLAWGRRFDALLVGMGIIDEPSIRRPEPFPLEAGPYVAGNEIALMNEARRQTRLLLDRFSRRCVEAGVAYKLLEDVGTPSDQILLESQRYDLVVLGRESRFRFATQDHPDDTLQRVLRHGPRPVVSVPEKVRGGTSAVVAYDGSLQSARALFAFWASGVAEGMPVRVISVAPTTEAALAQGNSANKFLDAHGIKADLQAIASNRDPATELLEAAERFDAGLIVAGAYGQPRLREFFLGSVTRTLSGKGDFPLFLAH